MYADFFVEEPSMEAFLNAWLPRRLAGTGYRIIAFQGKKDLLRKLENRLRGYRRWIPEDYRLVVIVDRDSDDCSELFRRIEAIYDSVNLKSRSTYPAEWQVATCIAIEELEAWYFGDWSAVRTVYHRVSPNIPAQSRYRNPDSITGGTWEAFEHVMKRGKYFAGGLQKTQAAHNIGTHIDATRSSSPSFKHFDRVINEVSLAGGKGAA